MAGRLVGLAALLMASVFIGAIAGNATVAGLNTYAPGYALPAIGDERTMLAGVDDGAECQECAGYEAE